MNLKDSDTTSHYIAALYHLGKADLLETAPAVNIVQCIGAQFGALTLAGVLGGVFVVTGGIYRQTNDLPPDHDLFVQELWDDWPERDDGDHAQYVRALQFTNCSLNNDAVAAVVLWKTAVNEKTSSEEDTEFIYRLLEDMQEIIKRLTDDYDEEL